MYALPEDYGRPSAVTALLPTYDMDLTWFTVATKRLSGSNLVPFQPFPMLLSPISKKSDHI